MPQSRPLLIFAFFLTLLALSILLLGWLLWPFLSTLILAFVVAGLFNPLYRWLARHMKPQLASFLSCLVIFLVLFVPVSIFVGILATEAINFIKMAQDTDMSREVLALLSSSEWLDRASGFFERYGIAITPREITDGLTTLAKFVGKYLLDQATAVTGNILAFVMNFFFMLLIIYFFFIDGVRLRTFIMDLSPLPDDQDDKIIDKFRDMSGAILFGNGLGGLVQGVFGGVVFAIFGIPQAFLWGVIMGMLAFLPIVGIGAVFVPAAVILYLEGRVGAAVFFVASYAVVSPVVESILKPKLVGDRVKMHPLLVFLSIIGGLKLFGILGVIYGPLVVTTFLTLTDIYHSSYQSFLEPRSTAELQSEMEEEMKPSGGVR